MAVETHFTTETDTAPALAGTDFLCDSFIRERHGGGVSIFHRKMLNLERIIEVPLLHSIEVCALKNDYLIIIAIYWPPTEMRFNYTDFDSLISFVTTFSKTHDILLCGDFNLSGVDWSMDHEECIYPIPSLARARPYERDAVFAFSDNNLLQVNTKPNSRQHYLDLVITNRPEKVNIIDSFEHALLQSTEHHSAVSFQCKQHITPCTTSVKTIVKIDHPKLEQLLTEIEVSSLYSRERVTLIMDKFKAAVAAATTTVTVKMRSYETSHPWLKGNDEYKRLRKLAQKLGRTGKLAERRATRKSMSALYDKLKREYFNKQIAQPKGALDLYRLKNFTKNRSELPTRMTSNGISINTDDRLEHMDDHLSSAFLFDGEEIYSSQDGPFTTINRIWAEHFEPNRNFLNIDRHTEEEVMNALAELDIKKHPGSMLIPVTVFKQHATILSKMFTVIFNACAELCWVPPEWLSTQLIPIPKKGSPSEITNYRGIAISNVVCKLIDKLITAKLTINAEKVLSDRQYGFRQKRGTTACLLDVTQRITEGMAVSERVDAVFLDMTKAFDRLSHTKIVEALATIGMPLLQTRFLMALIMGRKYQVKIGETISTNVIIPASGCPQGSHMGPVLFNLVANSVHNYLPAGTETAIYQYADDMVIIRNIKNGEDEDDMQDAINRVDVWATQCRLKINANKTALMKFTRRNTDLTTTYQIRQENIASVDSFAYLGLILDTKLTFNQHATFTQEKCIRHANAAIRLAKYIGSRMIAVKLYRAYIDPVVCYAAPIWTNKTRSIMDRIEAPQKRITRFALGKAFRPNQPNYMPYLERCAVIGIPTATQRAYLLTALFTKKLSLKLTYTENEQKINEAFTTADPDRRIQPPLINRACLAKTRKTSVGHLLSVIETIFLDHISWNKNFFNFKQIVRNHINIYM